MVGILGCIDLNQSVSWSVIWCFTREGRYTGLRVSGFEVGGYPIFCAVNGTKMNITVVSVVEHNTCTCAAPYFSVCLERANTRGYGFPGCSVGEATVQASLLSYVINFKGKLSENYIGSNL